MNFVGFHLEAPGRLQDLPGEGAVELGEGVAIPGRAGAAQHQVGDRELGEGYEDRIQVDAAVVFAVGLGVVATPGPAKTLPIGLAKTIANLNVAVPRSSRAAT